MPSTSRPILLIHLLVLRRARPGRFASVRRPGFQKREGIKAREVGPVGVEAEMQLAQGEAAGERGEVFANGVAKAIADGADGKRVEEAKASRVRELS